MKNRRGLVSNFLAFFGATIAIVLILVAFVFLVAPLVKKWNNAGSDVAVFNEEGVEVDDVFEYSDRYVLLNEVRVLVADEKNVDAAMKESGYGE